MFPDPVSDGGEPPPVLDPDSRLMGEIFKKIRMDLGTVIWSPQRNDVLTWSTRGAFPRNVVLHECDPNRLLYVTD